MTLDDFRLQMRSYRQSVDDESKSLKDPYIALERLRALYAKFDAAERDMADQVLGEWALSDEEGIRFDALALIDDLKIGTAVPALKELPLRLTSSTAPSAPHELKRCIGSWRDWSIRGGQDKANIVRAISRESSTF